MDTPERGVILKRREAYEKRSLRFERTKKGEKKFAQGAENACNMH